MVRLGVVSDSHGSEFWAERFLEKANREGYDGVFHLGDGEAEARWLGRRLRMPLVFVAGNCDIFSRADREALAEYEGCRLIAVHGHLHDVKYGLSNLSYYAEERGANVALYGHTHRANAEYAGPVLMVNPGPLMKGFYAELTISEGRATPRLMEL